MWCSNLNSEKLSKRLGTVAQFVPMGAKIADIGSDHAYLPCYLAKKKIISKAIAGEVVKGPYTSACNQVMAEGLTDVISVRLGDGLEVISTGEADCITIAGMGGELITGILDAGKEKLESVKRLVLQPNTRAKFIRKWLLDHNWELIDEEILEEDGKIYEVLVGEKGDPLKPYGPMADSELLLGPHLVRKKSAVFLKKWSIKMKTWQQILRQLEKAPQTEENFQKKQEIIQLIQLVKEVLQK